MMRAASASLAVASVFLLATCDLDKLQTPENGGVVPPLVDSTDLTITGATTVPLGGTSTVDVISSTVSLGNVIKRFYSSQPTFVKIDSVTGVMTGMALGTSKVSIKILAPELGSGVSTSRLITTIYKGLKFTSPLVGDSILGLGPAQNKTAIVFGTNNANANVAQITPDSIRSRDTTVFRISGTTISGRKNGTAQLVAFFGTLRDSVAVRVRQVAKSITFPTSDYTARHLNFNVNVPLTVKDITDSVIVNPGVRWKTKDTTIAKVDSITGVLRVKQVATDSIIAKMDTVQRAQRIVVAQVAGSITKFLGDARTDTVALPVKVLPQVTVLDSGLTPIVGTSVVFKPGVGVNASVQDTLQVTDVNGRAKPTAWKLGNNAGAQTLIATSGSQTTTFTATAVPQKAFRLGFGVSPTPTSTGVAMNPSITVQVQDSLGNVITSATNSITLSISNNPGGATLAGTLTQNAVAGTATFSNISLNAVGTGYTLQASTSGLTAAISNAFDIFGAATKLGFTTQPVGTSAGATMANIRVAVQDASGSTVPTSSASITLSIQNNAGGSTLSGTTTVSAVNGVATFSTISLNNAGSGYTFAANAAGLSGAVSNPFTMSAVGAASKLGFGVQPTTVVAGASINPAMTVRVLDANGALVTSSNQQVTLSIESTSPTGGTITGTTSQNASSGIATFNNIQLTKSGTGYKLLATGTGSSLTTATSSSFDVTTGVANKLGFVQQPLHTVLGNTLAPAVTVEVQDASGNRVTAGSPVAVSLAFTSATCTGATLTGSGAQNTASGLATFSGLSINNAATGCGLTATSTGLTSANSQLFNSVQASGAARLTFTTEPSSSANAGSVLAQVPTVTIQDAAGNNVSASAAVAMTLSILPGSPQTSFTSGTTQPASTTTSSTFPGLILNTAGTYRFIVSATGYRPDTSAVVTISPAAIARVNFTVQPSNIVAGVPFSPVIKASVQDNFGNTVPGATNVLTLNAQLGAAPFTSYRFNDNSFNYSVTAVNGVATFTGLSVINAATAMRLNVFSTGLSGSGSVLFDVAPGPLVKLGFVLQPPSTDTVATVINSTTAPNTIQVAGQDSVGNTISDFSNAVTIALTGGTTGATLGGTKTAGPVAGVASFNDLTVDRTGTSYQLSASASGVATGTSSAFTIDPLFLNTANVCCQKSVVIGSTIYFVHSNALKSMPVGGGIVTTIQGSTNPSHIATDGVNVFWSERGNNNNGDAFIRKYVVGAGTISVLTVAQSDLMTDDAAKMFADGINVYFIARNLAGTGLAIKAVSTSAVSAAPTELHNVGSFAMPFFHNSGGFIYFFDPATTTVRRITTAGASLTTLSTTTGATKLGMSGTTLFFNDGVLVKSIANAPSAGGPVTPTAVFTAPGTVYEISGQTGFIYFNVDGTIRRYSTSDLTTFAVLNTSAVQAHPNFSFDATGLYFFHNFGRIARVPK
jgi:hypothetical protein